VPLRILPRQRLAVRELPASQHRSIAASQHRSIAASQHRSIAAA
jgi:hypothetical protein